MFESLSASKILDNLKFHHIQQCMHTIYTYFKLKILKVIIGEYYCILHLQITYTFTYSFNIYTNANTILTKNKSF